ncbi:anhydro-N-acetylmuramic acid kinase [Sulfurimonas sp. SWIR-19]|uniref:anhydro-N-acetylmuramic acid kinase n=1 Tax=Sulfurimonas sp. SWIR-19 TaxID=2878390 RepID=UPI001CF2D1EC|nr:anhydro-N-acetylmuramic acid kinase [Sulfurimonas sp. SWIR-19]UCN00182.1 anhydro-N-acetylmuramic acid kinase [Sulfurimonas sp. SWIR-19]
MKELYLGVMSGTSLDGIDIALCEIDDTHCKLFASAEYPFPGVLKEEILKLIAGFGTLRHIGECHSRLGLLFAECINDFLKTNALHVKSIHAIGLHGQTLWHAPDSLYPFSMQLGNPNIVAAKTGITTVADFRGKDIANGGQGAPFAPAFHQFLFADTQENTAVLNIGGMANISLLFHDFGGWDVGCGNVLIDMWMQKTQSQNYDAEGALAKSGEPHEVLLAQMLRDDYFDKKAPKSTGREYFNAAWLEKNLRGFEHLSDAQIQRTLLELTAHSIANDVNATQATQLIICGGGAKNSFLMQRLSALCRAKVLPSDALGINSDFLEAMAFAWFAKKRIHQEPLLLKKVTGAQKDSIAGAIYAAD